MFMTLMDALAWVVVIGLAWLVLALAGGAIGALIGNTIAAFRRLRWTKAKAK